MSWHCQVGNPILLPWPWQGHLQVVPPWRLTDWRSAAESEFFPQYHHMHHYHHQYQQHHNIIINIICHRAHGDWPICICQLNLFNFFQILWILQGILSFYCFLTLLYSEDLVVSHVYRHFPNSKCLETVKRQNPLKYSKNLVKPPVFGLFISGNWSFFSCPQTAQ